MTLFTSSEVLKEVNITYRQLSYWQLKGIIKPTLQRLGSRDFKRYTQKDIDALKSVKKLLDEGYSLPTAETLSEIAKRKEVEEKLRESEQKFRHLVETTTDWVWEVNRDGAYTYASPKIKDLLGYEVSEVIGRTPFDLMPQEEAKKISKFFYEKATNKEAFFRLENINIHKEGRWIVLETNGIPIFDEEGNLKGYRGIDRDITERKKREIALQESKERFQLLYERAPIGYQSLNEDGCFIEVNQTWLNMLGYSQEEVIGRWFGDFVTPEHQEGFKKNFPRFKAAGEIHDVEFKMLRKDETIMNAIFDGTIIYDNQGKFKQTHCSMKDISERKRIQDQLAGVKDYTENIIKSMFDTLIVIDPDSKIKSINKATTLLLGYKEEELIGKPVGMILATTTATAAAEEEEEEEEEEEIPFKGNRLKRLIKEGFIKECDMTYETKSGERIPVSFSGSVMRDKDGKLTGVVCIGRDLRERKKAEETLRVSEEFNRRIIAGSHDCIKVLDLEGRLLFMSKGGQQAMEIEDITPYLNKSWIDFWKGKDREVVLEAISKAKRGNTGIFQGYRPTLKGKSKWWDVIITPITGSDGKVERLMSISRDITERKKAEEERERLLTQVEGERDKLQTLIDSIADEIWFCDAKGHLSLANITAARGLGFERAEEMYQSMPEWLSKLEIYTPDGQPRAQEDAPLHRSLQGEILKGVEEIVRHPKTGEMLYRQVSSAPLRGKAGQIMGAVAVVRDITERKKAEKGEGVFKER